MDQSTTSISSLYTDYLPSEDSSHGVFYFEPFRSHNREEAISILKSECEADFQKMEIFKTNMTELFKRHYCQISYSPVTLNNALLERIKIALLSSASESEEYSELEGRIFENDHEQCYAVMHIASYVLKEQDLLQIQLSVPPPIDNEKKTMGQVFLDAEISILRFLNVVREIGAVEKNPRVFAEFDEVFKELIESYNNNFNQIENKEIHHNCIQAARTLIQCYWMIVSKFIIEDHTTYPNIICSLEAITCPIIMHFMMEFWINLPAPSETSKRRFFHHSLMRWIVPKYTEIEHQLLEGLISKHQLARSGVFSKTFTLFFTLQNSNSNLNFSETMLGSADSDNFPSREINKLQLKRLQDREYEKFPIEHFETMWESIIVNSVQEKSTLKKILIRAVVSDLENQIFTTLKVMNKLSEHYLVQFSNKKHYERMTDVIRKRTLPDAQAARITSDGYKLIANLQLHRFSHFVNLSVQEAEHCFDLILEILTDVAEFENTKTPYEVLSLAFQNACLHRNLELRNLMAQGIVEMLESTSNFHAIEHFLMLVAKVLRSQSSEELMKKNTKPHKSDPIIHGVKRIMSNFETLNSFYESGDGKEVEQFCKIHLICTFILTFCDQTFVFSPLEIWYQSLSRILKMSKSKKEQRDTYCNLIYKYILTNSSIFPVPQGQLLETLRDGIPVFIANWTLEASNELVEYFSVNSNISKLLEKDNSMIRLLDPDGSHSPLSSFALHRLNMTLEGGLLVPFLAHKALKHYDDSEVQHKFISNIHHSLELSWSSPSSVQHEDMEYICHVALNPKLTINIYMQFKILDELDGSESISVSIGRTVVKMECSSDSESLRCLYSVTRGEKYADFQSLIFKTHTFMMQVSNGGDEISIITSGKAHTIFKSPRKAPVDELKIAVNSLHHTIPIVFQGDCQSLIDINEMGISSKNIENARRFTLVTKGRKLNIGQIFHSVIPVRHSQMLSIMLSEEQAGFESTVKQLRAAGGFGFVFHSFTKVLVWMLEQEQEKQEQDMIEEYWNLLLAYLFSPFPESEKFTRLEAIRMTCLLLRSKVKVPEAILQKIFDACMMTDRDIREVVFLTELLSEPSYWENDLVMFYRLLVRFKSTNPGGNLDKLLPLILQIVAKIIKNDTGSDQVHDIATITIEIFKEWCRDPHLIRTTQLVTFMMDLFDFENIHPHHEKFQWVEESVLEREISRQPILVLNNDEPVEIPFRHRTLLQLDIPLGNLEDELFELLTPIDQSQTEKDYRLMARNRDYLMKGLLQILLQAYVLCPDTLYSCFDSITAEKICYLIEVNNNGKVIGGLVEMYEAIINHNIYSDKITKIFQLDLLRILARQLRNKPLTLQTVNALFSILLREQVDVSAGLDTSHLECFTPNALSCQCVYPLLTVLDECVDDPDVSVFTVVCTSLNKVYIYNNQLTQALTGAGLDENMTEILLKLAKMGDFRVRNEKLKAILDPWFAFAVSIVRVGVNGRKSVFDGAARFISNLLLLYAQENARLLDDPDSAAQRLIRDNIHWTLCILLLQLFKFLLDIALADSNKHRSASNSSLHMLGYEESSEEVDIEITPQKPTKFWDEIAQKVKESVLGPNHNMLKSPYRKHKETPLSAEEMRHRIKEVLILCQYFFKVAARVESDEEDNLYKIFFEELSKWVLDDSWPNCIWVAADMMFITNIFANCVTFVMTDIHQYILPHRKVFIRQKASRMEFLLQKICRSYQKIATVFGNVMDIDQMMKLTMENITQREEHHSVLFKFAVMFLQSPNKGKGPIEFPQPRTPDFIQRMTVESEIASRYWLDQRNEIILKIDLRSRIPQYSCDVTEINNSLDKMQKLLAAPRNMKRVNEVCELMVKIEENERVFTRLSLIKNKHRARKISTILGPRGERMITDMTDIRIKEMFAKETNATKTSGFRAIFESLAFSRIRKPDVFARYTCVHGILVSNGIQSNPIFQLHRSGITALPCGSHLIERTYLFEDMTMIFRRPMRPWDALEVSFEILMKNHETILIFSQQKFAKVLTQHAGKLIATEMHLMAVTKQWEEGKTSNFEYLMMLNLFSGRTIHDSSAYPVFPRIITKFGEHEIDLLDKNIYRKLDKPVAAQDLISMEKHKEHYNELKENEEVSHLTPYHFGSMCSNRGVVSFYNIRLLPFGEEAIELQDGRFDFPDRLFHNIESGLGMGKVESSNDYKELVPELFTTVEVLRNENQNEFGERQNGDPVGDVEVPYWCYVNGKPVHEFFIRVHRQALESEFVQTHLHNWIDLIFGYKARGKAALEAINVYHPAVYPGSSPPSGFDSLLTNAYEANQKTLGTAPNQLFNTPHPKREVVPNRFGSVRNIHGLSFGKELTVGAYEASEFTIEQQSTQRVWRRMKSLKSKIFNKSDKSGEPIQLFKRTKDRKEKDPSDLNVKVKNSTLIISDGTTEAIKEHSKKVIDVSVDEQYVACLIYQGPIEVYKMIYKSSGKSRIARTESKVLTMEFYGTIPIQNGHYLSVDVCATFSSIFAVYKVENHSVISVWDLHTHHIRSSSEIDGVMESCGVLKNIGELVVVEKWNGEQERFEKHWREHKKRKSKKPKYCGKTRLAKTEQIMAKISINAKPYISNYTSNNLFIHSGVVSTSPEPGMGIQTLAMIRNDNAIVLFETLSLSQMRVLEVDNGLGFCLRELRYQEDNTLVALYKENRALRKKNKELYKDLGCAPPTRTWRFRPK